MRYSSLLRPLRPDHPAGSDPFMLQNVFQSFLVVAERPQLGLLITIASGLTNMILDAYFIAVLRLGVVAAAATAISQSIGGLIPCSTLSFRTGADSVSEGPVWALVPC